MFNNQLARFLVVGGLTVAIDGAVYRLLAVLLDVHVDGAKALGFIAGTVFSYFANRHFTFKDQTAHEGSWWKFAVLYASTLAANVAVNTVLLDLLDGVSFQVLLSFLVATGVSATLNFLGMKFFVFRARALTI